MALKNESKKFFKTVYISHLAALRPNLGQKQGSSLTHSMLMITLFQEQPKVHRESRNEVGSQSLNEGISDVRAGNIFHTLSQSY